VFEKIAKVKVETNLKEMFDEVKAFLGRSYFNADTNVQIMNLFLIDQSSFLSVFHIQLRIIFYFYNSVNFIVYIQLLQMKK
jgi:hypothetical protein